MYAASGILILCRWPSCALAKGRLVGIKLVSIKELYHDAWPTKSQDLHCKTSKTDIPLQEDQNKIVQKQ